MLWMSHKSESALCPFHPIRKNGSLSAVWCASDYKLFRPGVKRCPNGSVPTAEAPGASRKSRKRRS